MPSTGAVAGDYRLSERQSRELFRLWKELAAAARFEAIVLEEVADMDFRWRVPRTEVINRVKLRTRATGVAIGAAIDALLAQHGVMRIGPMNKLSYRHHAWVHRRRLRPEDDRELNT